VKRIINDNDQVFLLRAPEGPLAVYVASFSKWTSGQDARLFVAAADSDQLPVLVGGSHRRRSECAASARQSLARRRRPCRGRPRDQLLSFLNSL
jgi:hypothetical protein